MTNNEAITTLKANYPDSCYEQLREAVDEAIEALKAQDAAGDTISRQAALDALRTCYDTETVTMSNGDEYINYEDAVGEIEQLPPAQPEVIHCRECINHTYIRQIEGGTIGVCESLGINTYGNWYCGNAKRRKKNR